MNVPARVFSADSEPKAEKMMNYCSSFKHLSAVEKVVGPDAWECVCRSPLWVIIKFVELNFNWSSRLVHYLFCKSLVCSMPYELWFLISGQPARFSLFEFEEITGLNCGEIPLTIPEEDVDESNMFWDLFNLKKGRTAPSIEDIERVSSSADFSEWSLDDKVKLSYLAILSNGLLGIDQRTQIPLHMAKLVMDLDFFENYPWGRIAFADLVKEVKVVLLERMDKPSYVCKGFIQVFQLWAYVYIPYVGERLGHRVSSDLPYLLRYKGIAGKTSVEFVFSDHRVIVKSMIDRYTSEALFPHWPGDKTDDLIHRLIIWILEGKLLVDSDWPAVDCPLQGSHMGIDSWLLGKGVKRRKVVHSGGRRVKGKLTDGSISSATEDDEADENGESYGLRRRKKEKPNHFKQQVFELLDEYYESTGWEHRVENIIDKREGRLPTQLEQGNKVKGDTPLCNLSLSLGRSMVGPYSFNFVG